MVNTTFVQCAGTNGIDSVLIAHIVVVHVPVYLGFGIEWAEVEHVLIVCFEYESIIGSK